MKKIVFCLVFFLLLLFLPTRTLAQESPEEAVKKYGITFPIAELGNCANFNACKNYCDNETNKEQCVSFAKKKGFYKDEPPPGQNPEILQSAKTQLGCSSEESCRAVCEKEENFEKCSEFAQKHGLGGPRGNPGDRTILEKAKTILGCDSESSCRAVCENPANQEKCSEFAKQTGLGGGIKRVGPGGCDSEESCRSYCESHREECMQFGEGGPPPGSEDANRRGPGGCNSEESCRVYCEAHQDECRQFGGAAGPSGQDMESFCKENPDKCSGMGERSSGSQMSSEEYCRTYPKRCRPPEEANRKLEDSFRQEPSYAPYQPPPGESRTEFDGQPPPTSSQQFESQYQQQTQPSTQTTEQEYRSSEESSGSQGAVQGAQDNGSLLKKVFTWLLRLP